MNEGSGTSGTHSMSKAGRRLVIPVVSLAVAAAAILFVAWPWRRPSAEAILAAYTGSIHDGRLVVEYPLDLARSSGDDQLAQQITRALAPYK